MSYTAIVDYGVGNLKSVSNALTYVGLDNRITGDPQELERANSILLPGVGAFPDAARKLRQTGLDQAILRMGQDKPVLGICLGMQLLFEESLEYGRHKGLGLLAGRVVPMEGAIPEKLKIPHIGWNALQPVAESPLLRDVKPGDCVYFVHSYYADGCADSLVATAEYGIPITAMVQKGNVMGCQFHPEKSGPVGLAILRAFCEEEGKA